MAYAKPDSKLVRTPVEELCGNPGERTGVETERGGVPVEGASKETYSEGIETVTFVTGIEGGKKSE